MEKKIKPEVPGFYLTLILLSVPFLYMPLTNFFHVPSRYQHLGAGLLAAALLAVLIWDRKALLRSKQIKWLTAAILAFFLPTVIGQVLGYQSGLYYLSGLSNNGRFFVFTLACAHFLNAGHRETMRKLMDAAFWVNFLLSLFQYFVLGAKQDFLGGIFGTTVGCNAFTNVFFLLVLTHSVLAYMNKQEKAWLCLAKCAAAMIVAALAELKIFFIEFVILIALVVLLTRFSKQKIYLILGGVVGVVLGIWLLTTIFPYWSGWFNPASIWKEATNTKGYTYSGDMNRLTAVPIAWNTFLTTWPQKFFGLGLGNCDFGPFPSMTAPFYAQYYTTNYGMFSSGVIMLETGVVGMVTYLGIFVVSFFAARSRMRSAQGNEVYCLMGQILSVMCLVLFLYNCTLRTEVGYLMYYAIALPFMREKTE